jgi:HEAT repeat protein
MFPVHSLLGVTLGLLALWVALSLWIVVGRSVHARRRRRLEADAAGLGAGTLPAAGCPSPRLRRVASGPDGPAARIAARELVRRESSRLLRLAGRRGLDRAGALRVLARGGSLLAFPCLRRARDGGRPDVIAAVVAIAGEIDVPEADRLLLDILVAGDHPRSRTATALETHAHRLVSQLLELSESPDPVLRYWALMLLPAVPGDARILAAALRAGTDVDAAVRGAAARLLGALASPDALLVIRSLLADDVFFVRAHAARAAARLGAGSVAREIAALLADASWWVRAAAKDSLLALGQSGFDAAVTMLADEDRFARDGASEVILGSGRLDVDPAILDEQSTLLLERLAG